MFKKARGIKRLISLIIFVALVVGCVYGVKSAMKPNSGKNSQPKGKLEQVTNINFDRATKTFTWKEVTNATAYEIEYSIGDTTYSPARKDTTSLKLQDSIQLNGRVVKCRVRAGTRSGEYTASDWSEFKVFEP